MVVFKAKASIAASRRVLSGYASSRIGSKMNPSCEESKCHRVEQRTQQVTHWVDKATQVDCSKREVKTVAGFHHPQTPPRRQGTAES